MDERVARWLHENSSAAADWPVDRVVAAKGHSTVAVVLPALDEERTVGAIVATIHAELVRRHLVDELVVLDSGSTDATARVAADAGARVVHRDEVLPDLPSVAGKGETLWRSLAATSSDIVVFVDADLSEFRADYVTGLVGPLLDNPDVHLVKAAYDRPLGRVTELVARPLLAMGWPQLTAIAQPLAGEYAGRRKLFEALPFPTGYGCELALLVDTWRRHGLAGIAQVDLGRRLHRHHDDLRLGPMAAEVLQAGLNRLGVAGAGAPLTRFHRVGGELVPEVTEVATIERPPMREFLAQLRATR